MTLQKLYTVPQAAEILGMHPQTVRQMCARGELGAQPRKGARYRISEKQLKAFMEANYAA